jgi:Uma2 family endonuclease
MAGVLVPSAGQPDGRLFTAADLAAFPTHLPSGEIDYELDHGRLIIIMVPPGELHGSVQLLIGTELMNQGQRKRHGRTYSEVGIVLTRNPDTVLGADLAFVGKAKLPVRKSREGYLETIPDLVVEIRSKNDTRAELERKAGEYLAAGVGIVLLVDPEAKTVAEHRAGTEPRVYLASETLALDEVIPGFRLDLAECFSESLD